MGSSTFAEIKRAIRDGLFEKVVNILNARRHYLSKKELDKIFYLGLKSANIFEWFLNNVDKYRYYLDENYRAVYEFGITGAGQSVTGTESAKIHDSLSGWPPKNHIKIDIVEALIERNYFAQYLENRRILRVLAANGEKKLIKKILRDTRSTDLDPEYAFKTLWEVCIDNALIKVVRCEDWAQIGRGDYQEYRCTDILGLEKCMRREFKVSYLGVLKCMKFIYSQMSEREKSSVVNSLLKKIGTDNQMAILNTNLLMNQGWIDYSEVPKLQITMPNYEKKFYCDELRFDVSARWVCL